MVEKQKSRFKETRQEMFHRLYRPHYVDMRGKIMVGGQWGGEGVRKRVRALARQETRLHVRQLREVKNEPLSNVQ
jgi:hypothetical protein